MKKTLLFFFLSLSAFAQEHTIQVQGSCDVEVLPDRAKIVFQAENLSKDKVEVVKKTTQQIETLKEKIKALKLSDLEFKNTNYQVFEARDWEKDHYVSKGTRAILALEVSSSDIPKLGETLTLAAETGIQTVGQMMIYLSQEKAKVEYLKCLDIAALDAKAKGEQLGRKLGFKLGDVASVVETPNQMPPQTPYQMTTMAQDGGARQKSAQIEPGKQNFSTTLQVNFLIKWSQKIYRTMSSWTQV